MLFSDTFLEVIRIFATLKFMTLFYERWFDLNKEGTYYGIRSHVSYLNANEAL